ncbi:hypothetical protein MKX08_000568 [Trichoderma sp. CBMAI-0020]|nr:hypothetical protein MKX08_000568 [Trichoderma sp. CBMAI-0020]
MASIPKMLLLPTTILALVVEVAANQPLATAIKKQLPDANEKLFPDHLAFEPLPALDPFETTVATNLWLDDQEEHDTSSSNLTKRYHPAFAYHFQESEDDLLKRAADVLAILQNRAACPSGTESCSGLGSPDKCCADGSYCTNVSDSDAEQIACCPNGATCGGGVGACPSNAVSCPSALGGGCCIPGYVCVGVGCVPSAAASGFPSSTAPPPQTTPPTHSTAPTGNPSTVIVTLVVTETSIPPPVTQTLTVTATGPGTETATGAPPYRPTDATSTSSTSASTSSAPMTTQSGETQTGCPTGFYGCLATHGGGCCRTDRDCQTFSCPASSSTIISHGVTVVVPADDVPTATASDKCASGWFLCGKDAESVAGCCPSGYKCGTASCFTSAASETNSVQKQEPEAPNKNAASSVVLSSSLLVMGGITGSLLLLLGAL